MDYFISMIFMVVAYLPSLFFAAWMIRGIRQKMWFYYKYSSNTIFLEKLF